MFPGRTNLARNIGGSCGTAFLATMLTRRTAAHETNMVRNLTTGNPAFNRQVHALAQSFAGGNGAAPKGGGPSQGAIHAALAFLYNQLLRLAGMLGYLDVIQSMMLFCACMIPLIFLMPRPTKGSGMGGH